MKSDKYKVRIVACGNKTADTYGRVSTTDLDTAMLRYILSWAASLLHLLILLLLPWMLRRLSSMHHCLQVELWCILYKLQLLPPGHVWLVHKAIYGLREAPNLWSEQRTESMTKVRFHSQGERYCVLLSEVHKPLCLIVKEAFLIRHPTTDHLGLTARVSPTDVVALSGIHVDDFLTTGPRHVVEAFLNTLRKMWKISDPRFLSSDDELQFLGVTIIMTSAGLMLHQHFYTEDFLFPPESVTLLANLTTSRNRILNHLIMLKG